MGLKVKKIKYVTLYKLIEEQTEYNEEVLVKHFKLSKELNKFAFLKNYTYNFILDALEERSRYFLKHIRSKITQADIQLSKKNYFRLPCYY